MVVPMVAVGTDRTGRLWKHLGPVCSETPSWPRRAAEVPGTPKTHSRPPTRYQSTVEACISCCRPGVSLSNESNGAPQKKSGWIGKAESLSVFGRGDCRARQGWLRHKPVDVCPLGLPRRAKAEVSCICKARSPHLPREPRTRMVSPQQVQLMEWVYEALGRDSLLAHLRRDMAGFGANVAVVEFRDEFRVWEEIKFRRFPQTPRPTKGSKTWTLSAGRLGRHLSMKRNSHPQLRPLQP